MNREYTVARYRALVDRARDLMPDIALTTDIIVGYPGETEEDFGATYRVMEDIRFDSAFMFKYSPRRGTVSAGYDDDVTGPEKQRRLASIIDLQRRITDERSARFVGREVEVLVDAGGGRGSADGGGQDARVQERGVARRPVLDRHPAADAGDGDAGRDPDRSARGAGTAAAGAA